MSSSTSTQTKPRNDTTITPTADQNALPHKSQQPQWSVVVRSMLTWKQNVQESQPRDPVSKKKKQQAKPVPGHEQPPKKSKNLKCTGSLCSNTKIAERPAVVSPTPETHKRRIKPSSSSSSSITATVTGTGTATTSAACLVKRQVKGDGAPAVASKPSLRRFPGCYECRMVVDPIFVGFAKDPSLRSNIFSCPDCGKVFMSPENLDHHQAVKHAVSELSPDDTSKNIVEIIFQSSWLATGQKPLCRIDRILKIRNTQRIISRFENYRNSIKEKATDLSRKHPRCVADGNELLRFHCTTLTCSLGLDGSSSLCSGSIPRCNVCSIIRNGFGSPDEGTLTTATSGRAHERVEGSGDDGDRRAMLVCRVIAGRVRRRKSGAGEGGKMTTAEEGYDSVAGVIDEEGEMPAATYSGLDELIVFNPRAILPCFVVIYQWF
ncbi:hypothetical protein MLD38_013031 [Melastoma candidum]|uniref:Uncharacterized protein n=1 Tax=Melastoma candidum TaxID=119954 RepID=A0ACB9R9J0_9MYRT|nr:hypothetical protein MLD38_013031 [Melastoma candidum]